MSPRSQKQTTAVIIKELKVHAPFTALGAFMGIIIVAVVAYTGLPRHLSETLFWTFHPIHVLLSAMVTAGMCRRHSGSSTVRTILVGYLGSVGIATLSDCVIPYAGEMILDLPLRDIRLGVIEKWWLVNPLAATGIALAFVRPTTTIPHAGHVFLSTWASLFHVTLALGSRVDLPMLVFITGFLFLAVWVPCCTSDIVFPLLFRRNDNRE